jgi:hypothetical protein
VTRDPLEAEVWFQFLSRRAEGFSDDEAIRRTVDDFFGAATGAVADVGLSEEAQRAYLAALRARLEEVLRDL